MGVSNCIFLLIFSIITIVSSARRIAQEDEYYYKLPPPSSPPLPPAPAALKPGITIIVGAITTIFTVTFILLLYVQHCKTGAFTASARSALPLARVDSGVNRKVIQQLPLFRFSSLRGQKDGLECAVCLTRFEPEEVLRLLPKCKHAFHVECVDTWLDQHSTCPLCRYRVRPEDVLLIDCHGSNHKALHNYRHGGAFAGAAAAAGGGGRKTPGGGIYSARHSSAGERGGRPPAPANDSRRRFSFDGWSSRRRRSGQFSRNSSRRDDRLGTVGDKHRLEHQILVSNGGDAAEGQRRRSEGQTAEEEVLYLGTEMLMGGGDEDDEVEEDEEEGSGSGGGGRSAAEIRGMRKTRSDVGERKGKEREEEGIVKKLKDWIPQFQQHHKPAANSAATSSSGPI